ncbi:hypothetical protein C8Q79DRAFT_1011626 [Trametes meyenii]|nr:hypothetical protein C8Q79DRAFT_1011626 [Trametes meyenii]
MDPALVCARPIPRVSPFTRPHSSDSGFDLNPSAAEPHIRRSCHPFIFHRKDFLRRLHSQGQIPSWETAPKASGEAWKAKTAQAKARYQRLAAEEKVAHALRHPNYKCQPKKSGTVWDAEKDAWRVETIDTEVEELWRGAGCETSEARVLDSILAQLPAPHEEGHGGSIPAELYDGSAPHPAPFPSTPAFPSPPTVWPSLEAVPIRPCLPCLPRTPPCPALTAEEKNPTANDTAEYDLVWFRHNSATKRKHRGGQITL